MSNENKMSNENQQTGISQPIPAKSLWFGFAGAAVAWILAGFIDAVLAWEACQGGEAGSAFFTQTLIRIVLGVITFGLLATAIASGVISFRNWRALSRSPSFASAEARGRREFMALVGVIVAVSLGMGIVWFAIPIYVIPMCVRTH